MACNTPTCWDDVKNTINALNSDIPCIIEAGISGQKDSILELFGKFCPTCNDSSNDPEDIANCAKVKALYSGSSSMVQEAAQELANIVRKKIQNGVSKLPRKLKANYFGNCGWGPDAIYNVFKNTIVPSILNEQFGTFLNICQSLNNITSPDGWCGQTDFCNKTFLGWSVPKPCVKNMGYSKSSYFEDDGFLNNQGKQISKIYCNGITILEAIKEDDVLECAARFGTWAVKGPVPEGSLVIRGDRLVFQPAEEGGQTIPPENIIYNSQVKEWRSDQERIRILKDIASSVASAAKGEYQKVFPMFKNIIDTAINNRKLLYNKIQGKLEDLKKNPELYNDLQFIALEQFYANLPPAVNPKNTEACGCASEALWGPPGIYPDWDNDGKTCAGKFGSNSAQKGLIWTDQNRQWECYLKLRAENANMADPEQPRTTYTVTTEDCDLTFEDAKNIIAGREVQPASQCASATILDVKKAPTEPGERCTYTITYRFQPSKLWFPQETTPRVPGDICNNSEILTIMQLVVKLLNDTRSPGCGYSLFHYWVMNLVPGNISLTEMFGHGGVKGGTGEQCLYSWPNENDNKQGTNVGVNPDELPTVLPVNCESVPQFMGYNNRSKLAWAAFFLLIFFKNFNPSDKSIDNAIQRINDRLNDAISQLNNCPLPYSSKCPS